MKTVSLSIFSYAELSEAAKERARTILAEINTSFDWWDTTFEDFRMCGTFIGVDVDTENTFFQLSYSQGDGSSFTAEVDTLKFIDGVNGEKWKEHAPQDEINFGKISIPARIRRLIEKNPEALRVTTGPGSGYGGESHLSVDDTYDLSAYPSDSLRLHRRTYAALMAVAEQMKGNLKTFNGYLYELLEKECTHLSSAEAIAETIEANEYEFRENGTPFNG